MAISEKSFAYGGTVLLALFLRSAISMHGHSGEGVPPMYGDYEAQRHWQEVTVNLPIREWYRNTSDNDLMYWGLDYPPLTAYHSLVVGLAARKVNSSYVELHESRGISTPEHKYFMRWSVLVADLLIYIPAVLFVMRAVSRLVWKRASASSENIAFISTLLALIYPGQILIDNGHFQYNNISLGFMLLAVAFIITDQNVIAAIMFCLALNYKQMELYHALPFFVYLLRECFSGKRQSFTGKIASLIQLGFVVIITFAILWAPWICSFDSFLAVVRRIFPLARGVFEDKVANFWCVFNVVVKLKEKFTNEVMALICLGTTLLAAFPSCVHLFFKPSKVNFLYSLINTSLAFFLFSFQVHEKSILLVALPVLLLTTVETLASQWFALISVFSMFPLLEKDRLVVAFVSTMEVIDESDGCGGKFSALVVSPQFEGKTLIQRHRLVNSALSEELKTIHAFSQKTFTPKQWAEQPTN
ncbi:unnamed protein product [Hermetia illucens]|uniref:Alpha-1,3-glucosyltransferase n=1 Tax=Hermetia illucens TaxID=343691 RepID=A0A7R8UF93_HERIL|nr:unnamed protein product [Hermetia illucens]